MNKLNHLKLHRILQVLQDGWISSNDQLLHSSSTTWTNCSNKCIFEIRAQFPKIGDALNSSLMTLALSSWENVSCSWSSHLPICLAISNLHPRKESSTGSIKYLFAVSRSIPFQACNPPLVSWILFMPLLRCIRCLFHVHVLTLYN